MLGPLRDKMASAMLNSARAAGRMIGAELVVELSDHSIKTTMEGEDKQRRAEDPNLYKRGRVVLEGYANPIKPTVRVEEDLEDKDEVVVEDENVGVIASQRYRKYMRQDLVSQLLTPKMWWRIITYALIGLGVISFINIIVTLWATGSF